MLKILLIKGTPIEITVCLPHMSCVSPSVPVKHVTPIPTTPPLPSLVVFPPCLPFESVSQPAFYQNYRRDESYGLAPALRATRWDKATERKEAILDRVFGSVLVIGSRSACTCERNTKVSLVELGKMLSPILLHLPSKAHLSMLESSNQHT